MTPSVILHSEVFGFSRWESFRGFTCGLGMLDFLHMHIKVSFSCNSVIKGEINPENNTA